MSPRKQNPDYEPDVLTGKREWQRDRKWSRRRQLGKPEPSPLAEAMRRELWLYRQVNGLTQQQLGDLLTMKQSQIARLESGFVEPSIETLTKISECLGFGFTIEVKAGSLAATVTRPEPKRRRERQARS